MTGLLVFSSSFSYFTTGTHQAFARCPNGYHKSPVLYCYWKKIPIRRMGLEEQLAYNDRMIRRAGFGSGSRCYVVTSILS
jgi:hypothetical protein